jgi:MYXO-CTERM domain-containing protein
MRIALPAAAAALVLFVAAPAAALQQPNGTPIPNPMGCSGGQPTGLLAALACACTQPGVCNIGAACPGGSTNCDNGQHGTCESTLWHTANDNSCIPSNHSGVDPAAQGAVTPETFHPTCGQTFTLVTRGTAQFGNVFGWYNAGTKTPAASDLHPMIQCGDGPGKQVVLDVTKDPAYTGGDIGFFLVTPQAPTTTQCAGGDCCATLARYQAGTGFAFYSQRELNPDQMGPSSFIHLVILQSAIAKNRFYFAWDDLYGAPDGDFADLVVGVDGVQCSGAGQTCDTGKLGVCAQGITDCVQGTLGCQPIFQPSPEKCDGLDDDCDGMVDDGATCPQPGDVCQNGKCVPHCGSAEFKCAAGSACDNASGLCVDPQCVGVSCAAGKICRAGTCGTPCDGIVCPTGTTCVGNACVDLCAGVSCAQGQVCEDGHCFAGCASCAGIACGAGMQCNASTGQCVDPSCSTPCPAGTHCNAGQCADDCSGAHCPDGESCVMGQCVTGGGGAGDGGSLGAIGPARGADGGAGGASGGNGDVPFDVKSAGCACTTTGGPSGGGALAAALGLVATCAAFAKRRRR